MILHFYFFLAKNKHESSFREKKKVLQQLKCGFSEVSVIEIDRYIAV